MNNQIKSLLENIEHIYNRKTIIKNIIKDQEIREEKIRKREKLIEKLIKEQTINLIKQKYTDPILDLLIKAKADGDIRNKGKPKVKKLTKFATVKWDNQSCWVDSVIMALFAYPTQIIQDNIINRENIENIIGDIKLCDKVILNETHEEIKKLAKIIQSDQNTTSCTVKSFWEKISKCQWEYLNYPLIEPVTLIKKYGSHADPQNLLDFFYRMYIGTFVLPMFHSGSTFSKKDLEIILNDFNELELNLKGMILITRDTDNPNEYLDDIMKIGNYNCSLISIIYKCQSNHYCNFIKDGDEVWYQFNAIRSAGDRLHSLGKFQEAKNKILKDISKLGHDQRVYYLFEIQ